MNPENCEVIPTASDLSEYSMDFAAYKILQKIGEPKLFTLKVHEIEKFMAIRLAINSHYPAVVVVDTEYYDNDSEWSLTGEGPEGVHCVWSPGA